MMHNDDVSNGTGILTNATTGELVGRLAQESKELVRKEVALAKAELRSELKDEAKLALGVCAGGIGVFMAVPFLLTAVVLALALVMPAWAAALIVGLVMLALGVVAALVGWHYRVQHPLSKTRKTLKEDARWAQQGLT